MDTAARFGEIPFVDFSRELVQEIFDGLVEAHILQVEEYANFIESLTEDLSTYINQTVDGVSFEQVAAFVENYELPEVDNLPLTTVLAKLESPEKPDAKPEVQPRKLGEGGLLSEANLWGGILDNLAPAVTRLVDKIGDPEQKRYLETFVAYNEAILEGAALVQENMPSYKQIRDAIASLIVSNKYSILQTLAKQGMMRLVVTEGEIETKLTFGTWNSAASGSSGSQKMKRKERNKSKDNDARGVLGIFKAKKSKNKNKTRTLTVNTAKSYQRDSSGSRVDVFGRVLIRFKSDYAPLNG